jgi:Lung seven transmembrane receptor
MGFGITKSRLGDEANVRISVISMLYFTLAGVESYLRIQTIDKDENQQLILSAVPLALIDSLICWWIFTSLIQTIRALKLRRNVVKLRFYVHFQNTLIFGVIMSILFMLYSIKTHKTDCAQWKNLWIDQVRDSTMDNQAEFLINMFLLFFQAFWHVLFSILLTVVAFLWRPDNNNHKYAFIPLLESGDADDENEQFIGSNYSDTKMRASTKATAATQVEPADPEDDTIKWVEENIVSASLICDSDEELMNTKFEISKMQ